MECKVVVHHLPVLLKDTSLALHANKEMGLSESRRGVSSKYSGVK